MSPQESAESKCREIYGEARDFFDQFPIVPNYGFKILYAPPLYQPPILFIGYQPGGADDDCYIETAKGADKRWPTRCEYATESWKLAKQMRAMFGPRFLEECVGINAIFLRAKTAHDYKSTVKMGTRKQIEAFCLVRVRQIVEAIDPKKIVAIGFDTLNLFGASAPDLINEKGRTLTRIGEVAGRTAIATLHLSGARISGPDLVRIRDRVRPPVSD